MLKVREVPWCQIRILLDGQEEMLIQCILRGHDVGVLVLP
jgi:hypothetical protein